MTNSRVEAMRSNTVWMDIDDFMVISRGAGPGRLLEIGYALGSKVVGASIVEAKKHRIISDVLLVWAASPDAMTPVKRRLLARIGG